MCGAQDLNTRVKVKLDDTYFVVDTGTQNSQDTRCRPLCLDTNNFVTDITSSRKMIRSIQLGTGNVLLERPYGQSLGVPVNRLVA